MPQAGDPGAPREPLLAKHADAPREPLLPWTALLCLAYSVLTAAAMLLGLLAGGVGPRWEQVDPQELWHARVAILLVFSAMVSEMCFLVSSSLNVKLLGWNLSSQLSLHGIGDSMLTLASYVIKTCTGLYLWCASGGVMHTDTQAFGGARPVYFGRFLQWSVAVPVLVLLTNRAFLCHCAVREQLARTAPSMLAAFIYVWAGWVMEVTLSAAVRWFMMFLCLVGASIVSADQLKLAHHHRGDELFSLKFAIVAYETLAFTLYAVLFLLGRFGVVDSISEQCLYAYCDATVKVFQGAMLAMLRNREDLGTIRRWWVAALSATRDMEYLISRAKVPVFALDLDGRVTAWNEILEELTGLTCAQVQEKALTDIVSADSREGVDEAVKATITAAHSEVKLVSAADGDGAGLAQGSSTLVEISIPVAAPPKGSASGPAVRHLAMSLVPKSTSEGGLAGVMAIGQDLSDIAELKMVQERKSALMAMLSHEIRSPLHGMMGLTAALLESDAGKTMGRQLGMIKGCAARLLDLVTNIMDLAQNEKRRQEGQAPPRPSEPVDVAAVVDEVMTMTGMAVDKMNKPLVRPSVRLINSMGGQKVPLIPGDAHKCTQMIYNLVTNACKFTERGSVSISARHLPDQQRLEVDVADTGRGISEEGQKRIFQPFQQEQNGDARSFQGIGLGLAVCTEIAELHGGKLRVRSQLGQGSTFTVSLFCDGALGFAQARLAAEAPKEVPLSSPQAAPQALPQQAGERAPPAEPKPRPLVLSVDDDEVNQEVIKSALSDFCDLFCAMDGHQALNYLKGRVESKQQLPDAVLLDIQMPGMTGFEVCESIRSSFEAAHARLPIIMVSAKAPREQTEKESYVTGTTDFLPKPFSTEILRHKVSIALQVKEKSDVSIGASAPLISREACERLREAELRADRAESEMKDLQQQMQKMQLQLQQAREEARKAAEAAAETAAMNAAARPLGPTSPVSLPSKGQPANLPYKRAALQRQVIAQLSRQLFGAKVSAKVMGARLQMLGQVASGCQDLLALPASVPALPGPGADDAGDADSDIEEPEPAGASSSQAQSYKVVAQVVSSQLEMVQHIASQSSNLCLPRGVDLQPKISPVDTTFDCSLMQDDASASDPAVLRVLDG